MGYVHVPYTNIKRYLIVVDFPLILQDKLLLEVVCTNRLYSCYCFAKMRVDR